MTTWQRRRLARAQTETQRLAFTPALGEPIIGADPTLPSYFARPFLGDGVTAGGNPLALLSDVYVPGLVDNATSPNFANTAKIQAALDYAYANHNPTVVLPSGTFCTGPLTLHPGQRLKGQGRGPLGTVLKALVGTTGTLLTAGTSVLSCDDLDIRDLVIDGSWNAASPSATTGDTLSIWALSPTLHNIAIINSAGNAIICNADISGGRGGRIYGETAHFSQVKIDKAKLFGIYFSGPNDSYWNNIEIIDPSLGTDLGASGVYLTGYGTVNVEHMHIWNRSPTVNRPASALYLNNGGNKFTNCNFESGGNAGVFIGTGCDYNMFENCATFAPDGTVAFTMGGCYNEYRGIIGGNADGSNGGAWLHYVGIVLGLSSSAKAFGNVIDILDAGADLGAVDFTNSAGNNLVRVRGNKETTGVLGGGIPSQVSYLGTPDPADVVDIRTNGSNAVTFVQRGARPVLSTTPAIAPISGAFGAGVTVTLKRQFDGKKCDVINLSISIPNGTAVGTGTGAINVTLPESASGYGMLTGGDAVNNRGVFGTIVGSNCAILRSDGSTAIVAGAVLNLVGEYLTT